MPIGHKISVFQTQSGSERTCRLTCECGLEVNSTDLGTIKSWALVTALEKLHNAKPERVILKDNEDSLPKTKKSKKQKPVKSDVAWNEYGDDDFAKPSEEN